MPTKCPFIKKLSASGTLTDNRSGYVRGLLRSNGRSVLNVKVAVHVAVILRAQRRIQIIDAELQVVVASLVREEPREHVVGAIRNIEPAVGA